MRGYSLSAPGGGEGRGEVGDSRALADTHLTLPSLRDGPLPLPPEGRRGVSSSLDLCFAAPCGSGQHRGGNSSYASLLMSDSAPMSNIRWALPSFSKPDNAACSRKISAGRRYGNSASQPIRLATSVSIHQSGRASPGGARNARWREMRRSELVIVPSFSPQPAAGRTTSAKAVVSVGQQSLTTTNGHAASASRTRAARGMLAAGLVPRTHSALTPPSSTASNSSTALRPGRVAMRRAFQNRRTRSTAASSSKLICAASWLARPPTSRPPIALGCPVNENGPMPGRPIRPVARWQLMIALTLSVPEEDWFTPCEYSVTVRSVAANMSKKSATPPGATSAMRAASASEGTAMRAASTAAAKPLVRAAIQSRYL
jgi:hypothetical protein